MLEAAHKVEASSVAQGGIPNKEGLVDTIIFRCGDVVEIECREEELDNVCRGKAKNFLIESSLNMTRICW